MLWVEVLTGLLSGMSVGEAGRLLYENIRVRQAVQIIRERQKNFLRGYAAGVFAERSRSLTP